jgi:hypothetical protein
MNEPCIKGGQFGAQGKPEGLNHVLQPLWVERCSVWGSLAWGQLFTLEAHGAAIDGGVTS